MARIDHRTATLVCSADACYDVPAFGADYCMKHSLETHARAKRHGGIWLMLIVAMLPAIWFVVYARNAFTG